MQQSIEVKQEAMRSQWGVIVMLHGRANARAFAESFCARGNGSPSLPSSLAGAPVICHSLSQSHPFSASDLTEFARYRTRRRTSQYIEKLPGEKPAAFFSLAVSAVNPSKCVPQVAKNEFTKITEQRCCAAA